MNNRILLNNSYFSYLLSTFLRKISSYIAIGVYMLYLSLILLIVPTIVHQNPLFIWTNESFNIGIFNLIFISIICAIEAVIIFRDAKDDGTELIIASKPMNRTRFIFIKFYLFLLVICFIIAISLIFVCFTMCFGQYNIITNPTGMDFSKIPSLIYSMILGNLINMLVFGSIAILISLIGGKVAIMVGTIATAFMLSFLNFLMPELATSPTDKLKYDYNTKIRSSIYYPSSYYDDDSTSSNPQYSASILDGNLDTFEYWTDVSNNSGLQVINYFDIGGQLSSTFNLFDLQDSTYTSAKNSKIGSLSSYAYNIDKDSKIFNNSSNTKDAPMVFISLIDQEGIKIISTQIIGIQSEYYQRYSAYSISDKSITICHDISSDTFIPSQTLSLYGMTKNNLTLDDLKLNKDEKSFFDKSGNDSSSDNLYEFLFASFDPEKTIEENKSIANEKIKIFYNLYSNKFFNSDFTTLTNDQKFLISSKTKMYCFKKQSDYWYENKYIYYSSKELIEQFEKNQELYDRQYFNRNILNNDFTFSYEIKNLNHLDPNPIILDSNIFVSEFKDLESIQNMYLYSVQKYVSAIDSFISWIIVSTLIYSCCIIIYAKTDIK